MSRRFSGQLNRTDFFPRFLFGIASTGLAPESFYGLPHGPDEHFDGTPVDVAAAGIVGVASNERSGFDTYHVVNDHWHDGISLDRVVDWISSAGIQVSIPQHSGSPALRGHIRPYLPDLWGEGAHVSCALCGAGASAATRRALFTSPGQLSSCLLPQ